MGSPICWCGNGSRLISWPTLGVALVYPYTPFSQNVPCSNHAAPCLRMIYRLVRLNRLPIWALHPAPEDAVISHIAASWTLTQPCTRTLEGGPSSVLSCFWLPEKESNFPDEQINNLLAHLAPVRDNLYFCLYLTALYQYTDYKCVEGSVNLYF
jgi:hypothetical protein